MAVKPISPDEVVGEKRKHIPDFVIQAFNELIAKHFDGRASTFGIKEVEAAVLRLWNGDNPKIREQMYAEHWLDVEDIFREQGWSVEFDKPGYNESGESTFTFRPRKLSLIHI